MIEAATERDLPEVRALLERLQLPLAGVDEQLPTMLVAAAGRASRTAWLYGAADALRQSLGATGQVTFSRVQHRYLTLSRDAIGESAFQEAYDAGRTTPIPGIMDMDPPAL